MAGKIYITGASGRLGRAVSARMKGAVPLVRRPSGLAGEAICDFSDEALEETLEDADALVHIAGSVDTMDRKGLWESNVELTRRIVKAAPPGCRILFASSVSVYGKRLAEMPADEETPTAPDSDYSRSKLEAENLVRARKGSVTMRISTIYGPGFEDYFRIFRMMEHGRMRLIGDGSNRIPFVHVDDVADAFAAALRRGEGVYVVAGEPLTQEEILRVASSELGVSPPEGRVGLGAAMLMARVAEMRYRLGGKKPSMTREHIAILAYDRVFDCSRARKELGFSPRPLEKGIRDMVREYRKKAGTQG